MKNQENFNNSVICVAFLSMAFVVVTALIFRQGAIVIDLGNGKPSVRIADVEKAPLKP